MVLFYTGPKVVTHCFAQLGVVSSTCYYFTVLYSSRYPRHTHADSIPYSTVGNLCHEATELTWHHNITLYVVYVCSNVVMSLRYGTQHIVLLYIQVVGHTIT